MTPKELAILLDTDPKTCRKFLRSLTEERAGKGGRWVIEESMVEDLKVRFANFNARKTTTLVITTED